MRDLRKASIRAIVCAAATAGIASLGAATADGPPGSYAGEAVIRTDLQGRLGIILDVDGPGGKPDGRADRVVLLTLGQPVTERVDRRLHGVTVRVGSGRASLATADGSFHVDLAIAGGADSLRSVGNGGVVLHDGVALQDLRLEDNKEPLDTFSTDEFVSVVAEDAETTCPDTANGGDGASSCSVNISFGVAPFARACSCSVVCAPGFNACCYCDTLWKEHCFCVKQKAAGGAGPKKEAGEF